MSGKGCIKCGSTDAAKKEVAMTGTGLSKMFDIQHNQFIVVYCKMNLQKTKEVFL